MSRITVSPHDLLEHRPLRLHGDADVSLQRGRGDEGYTLALFALLIIPIAVLVSFAVDLGAWYAQSSKLQRASDAAAMAGVVWLPNTTAAQTAAINAASANGYVAGGGTTLTTAVVGTTGYSAQISSPAPRYFSKIFASNNFNITRSATAQFNKPVPLGSPTSKFGNTPESCPQFQPISGGACGQQPSLWAAINGPYESHANGDPYSTKCTTATGSGVAACNVAGNPNGAANPDYRSSGYTFAIDVSAADVNLPITIQGWDVGQFNRSLTDNGVNVPVAGDTRDCKRGVAPFNTSAYYDTTRGTPSQYWKPGFGSGQCQTGDSGAGVQNFDLQLFANDGSDLTISKTTPLACHYRLLIGTAAYGPTKNAWTNICTFTPTLAGIYPLEVRNSGLSGVADTLTMTGWNAYSLRLSGVTTTKLYAVDDMSIWTNTPDTDAVFYLAEIKQEHAGKKVQIDLYDPGDGSGAAEFRMALRAPAAGAPAVVPTGGTTIPAANVVTACTYNATKAPNRQDLGTAAYPMTSTGAGCSIQTKPPNSSTATYNDGWLRIQVDISPNYTCGTVAIPDCWWTVQYDFGAVGSSFPSDRTVWAINVVGDPVHLVK